MVAGALATEEVIRPLEAVFASGEPHAGNFEQIERDDSPEPAAEPGEIRAVI